MRIAIVSFYLMESTIPLAKYLSSSGVDVNLYSLLPYGDQNTFVYDFTNNKQHNGFVDRKVIKLTLGEKLYKYLSNTNFKIFIYPDRWFQKIFFQDFHYAFRLAEEIKKEKYDLIHIIHSSRRFWLFLFLFLEKKKIVQTLHEVTAHEGKTSFFDELRLKWLIKKATPIIFHSNISKKRFIEYRKTISTNTTQANLAMIRFGLFETFQCFSNQTIKPNQNGKINILFFGKIVPYKGIHFVIEAVKLLQDRYPLHLIIAGGGKAYFDFKDIKSYQFINKFIPNEELVQLIEECDMVVLPYTSASQSGVPMAVFPFNKPIIASNIAGFKEVIEDLKTGILVNDINAESFASSIEMLLMNRDLKNQISSNIQKKYSDGEFSWHFIAEKTLEFYRRQINILN